MPLEPQLPENDIQQQQRIKAHLLEQQLIEQQRLKDLTQAFRESLEQENAANRNQGTLGDELEEFLIDTLQDTPELLQPLQSHQYYSVLAANMQEIVLGPIVQLADVKGLGAAFLFAKRLSLLKESSKGRDYITIFKQQISCIKLTGNVVVDPIFPLQKELARLGTIFTYKFPLVATGEWGKSLHPNKGCIELINPEKQKQLRISLAEYCRKLSVVITNSIHKYAEKKGIDLQLLIDNYLLEEGALPPQKAFDLEQVDRFQVMADAEIASRALIEELYIIDRTINGIITQDTYSHRNTEVEQLLMWVNRGISVITYNSDSFPYIALEEFRQLRQHATIFPLRYNRFENLKQAFHRYSYLRDNLQLLIKLRSNNILFEWQALLSLPLKARKYILYCDRFNDALLARFNAWSAPMFESLGKLKKLHKKWLKKEQKPLELDLFFARYSQEELIKILETPLNKLLQCLKLALETYGASDVTFDFIRLLDNYNDNYHYNYEFSKTLLAPTANPQLSKFMFHLSFAYFSFAANQNSSALNNFLFYLPHQTQEVLLVNHSPSEALLNTIRLAATQAEKSLRKRYQLLFKLPHLLVQPNLLERPEYNFILHHDWEDLCAIFVLLEDIPEALRLNKFSAITSKHGLVCHKKGYCLRPQQLLLDERMLPFIQLLLVRLKHSLPDSTLQALCAPWFIEAYTSGALKVNDLLHFTPVKIEGLTAEMLKKNQQPLADGFTIVGRSKQRTDLSKSRDCLFQPATPTLMANRFTILSPSQEPDDSSLRSKCK